MICWPVRGRALLRHAAESPEDRAVHRRGILERVLLLSCFMVLSIMLFTVACCSCSSSSFWASCVAGGVDGGGIDEGWYCGARYCCMTECMILTKSWTCCSEKLGIDGSAPGILMKDRMVYWKNRSDDDSWLDRLSNWLIAKRKRKGGLTVIDTRDRWSGNCIYDLIKRTWLALLPIVKDQIWWLDTILWCGG